MNRDGLKSAVGYVRVSTVAQAKEDRYGIEAQQENIRKYCEENGYEIKKWYIDRGESGAKESRTEFDRIAYEGEVVSPIVDAVIVSSADRVARDIYIYYAFKHKMIQKGVKLISVKEDFGEMGVFSVVLESFIVAMSQIERETIKTRMMNGRQIKAAHGGYAGGKAPYGYKVSGGKLVVYPKEAEMVKKIFEMLSFGFKPATIAEWLNENGYKSRSGKPFNASQVKSIKENKPVYEGMYKYGNMGYVKGAHEAILEPEN